MSVLPGLLSGYGSGSSSDESEKEEDPAREEEKTMHLKVFLKLMGFSLFWISAPPFTIL